MGLSWRGDWTSPVDIPHFYLGEWGDTPLYLKKKYKDYDTFRKSWTVKVSNGKELRIWNRTKTRAIRKVPNGKKVEVMFVKGKYEVEKIDRGNREALVTDASLLYIEWNILKLYDMC